MATDGLPSEEAATSDDDLEMTFSLRGAIDGYVQCIPLALGVAGYGVVFGVLSQQAGLTVAEATLMSATVVAGAAQLIAIELWADPVPVVAVVATTFVVNLRYVLMGAALRPWFRHLSPRKAYGSAFFTADENWALTIKALKEGSRQGAFLLGSGLAIWTFWVTATVLGATVGSAIDPERYALDFVFVAVFVAIAVELWNGASSLLPWTVAAAVALVSAAALPGNWYILLGGLAGLVVEVIRYE